ncbi:pectate lyase-like adhesive domain-containing protein [Bacillus thuringiensis]|uniref:Uncharacterized protein n=1 Tax=Bacillus thuringiensis TaxID=1428 RepID=A0A9X6TR59_BACTU|nr:pectate lyase-like adhesive domain-containing protein [Bacillus thuringiensis]PEA91148.1 hypothetical protein CON71_04800 [Bacillus thuringiensis]
MTKKSNFKKKLKATVTTMTTAGILLTSVSPSYAEEQQDKKGTHIEQTQKTDELTDAEVQQESTQKDAIKDKLHTQNSNTLEIPHSKKQSELATSERDVTTFEEFQAAIADNTVRVINIMQSIKFKSNVYIATEKEVIINGNADKGVHIAAGEFSIFGENTKGSLSLNNANISMDIKNSKHIGFLNHINNVKIKDVNYTGKNAFVSQALKFLADGNNEIETEGGHILFGDYPNTSFTVRPGAKYKGKMGHRLEIGGAKKQSNASINIENNAELDLESSDNVLLLDGESSNFNVGENAVVTLTGKRVQNFDWSAVEVARSNVVLNQNSKFNIINSGGDAKSNGTALSVYHEGKVLVKAGAEFNVIDRIKSLGSVVSGESTNPRGEIIVDHSGSLNISGNAPALISGNLYVKMDAPKSYEFTNHQSGGRIWGHVQDFWPNLSFWHFSMNIWENTQGFEGEPKHSWKDVDFFNIRNIMGHSSEPEILKVDFGKIGKISGIGSSPKV